jgi:hypothetical protein
MEHKLTKLMVEYSVVQKITSTYGQRLINMINPDDHRLHPQFKQLGIGDGESNSSREQKATIATGRFSSDFQQLPRPRDIYDPVTDDEELQAVETVLGAKLEAATRKMVEAQAKDLVGPIAALLCAGVSAGSPETVELLAVMLGLAEYLKLCEQSRMPKAA